jgi:hypothetical protein
METRIGRSGRHPGCMCIIGGVMTVALACCLSGCGRKEAVSKYERLFPDPDSVRGVQAFSGITEYTDSTLYDFLDGGAELYFDYGIEAVASAEYGAGQDLSIELSVYDMGSPENAFGIYSNFRYPGADFVDVGAEGMRTAGSLGFWKGRYYCRLIAFDTASEVQAAMVALAGSTAANITGVSDLPMIVRLLPAGGTVKGSEKFFRGQLGLNNIRYVAAENVFMLSRETEGAVAEYHVGEDAMTGFVIAYPDSEASGAARRSYLEFAGRRTGLSSHGRADVIMLKDGTRTLIARHTRYVIGVWDARTAEGGYDFISTVVAALGRVDE